MLRHLREFRTNLKEKGLRGTFRHYGWKLFAAIFLYYLIRDLTLYVALPLYIASRVSS